MHRACPCERQQLQGTPLLKSIVTTCVREFAGKKCDWIRRFFDHVGLADGKNSFGIPLSPVRTTLQSFGTQANMNIRISTVEKGVGRTIFMPVRNYWANHIYADLDTTQQNIWGSQTVATKGCS